MSRTQHARKIRGSMLSWRRWHRRNMFPTYTRARERRRDVSIEHEVHDMWLDELGVALVKDLFRGRKHFRVDIGGADDCPCCVSWDRYSRDRCYDDHPDWAWDEWYDFRDDYYYRMHDEYIDDVERRCRCCDWGVCTRPPPDHPTWPALWVDGKVHDETDWRDHETEAEEEPWWQHDYDCCPYEGEEEFWANDNAPEVPGTEVLAREREAEKLKAGDRFYRQRKRTVAMKVA